MHPDRMRVPVGPGSVAVTRYGHADRAIVLLHGFPLASSCWRRVAPTLARAGWAVICPDLLGHGESDRPLDAALDAASQAGWMREAMSAMGISRAAVVGHDVGGLVALELAHRAPALVQGLALVSPLVPSSEPPPGIAELQRETGRHAVRLARDVTGATSLLAPVLARRLGSDVVDPGLLARASAPYVGREGVRHLLALARTLDAAGEHAGAPPAPSQPALVLRGEREGPDPTLEQWLARCPRVERDTVVGAAALAPEEAPGALAARLLTFLTPTNGTVAA